MIERDKREYDMILRLSYKRFLQECRHELTKNGRCVKCFRKVIDKRIVYI